jgi:hypothetical protein
MLMSQQLQGIPARATAQIRQSELLQLTLEDIS